MKALFWSLLAAVALAQQPARPVKPVPPPGVEISAQDRAELQSGLDHLQAEIEKLRGNPLLPDVRIYSEAVRFALQYDEFFNANEVAKARTLLQHGEERAPIPDSVAPDELTVEHAEEQFLAPLGRRLDRRYWRKPGTVGTCTGRPEENNLERKLSDHS